MSKLHKEQSSTNNQSTERSRLKTPCLAHDIFKRLSLFIKQGIDGSDCTSVESTQNIFNHSKNF